MPKASLAPRACHCYTLLHPPNGNERKFESPNEIRKFIRSSEVLKIL